MTAIVQRQVKEAEALLARAWHSSGDRASIINATIAEHLRSMIYGAFVTPRDASATGTIHTTRLLTSMRRVLELMWPQHITHQPVRHPSGEDDDLCTAVLRQLEKIGDAFETGGGQWIATPLRIIRAADARTNLVVGTAPLSVVSHVTGVPPVYAGVARFISGPIAKAGDKGDIVQSADAWLGEAAPLVEWTSQIVADHETRMEDSGGVLAEQLEVYAPDVARNQRRSERWIPAGQIGHGIDGPRLCRPQQRFARSYDRPHYLAHFEFKRGALVLRRSASIEHRLTLRLRFGLDVALKSPRKFAITALGQNFAIEQATPLPDPESRVYALGWKDISAPPPSQRIIFPADAMPFVVHALGRLHLDTSRVPWSRS